MNVLTFKTVWKGIVDAFDVRDRRVGYVIGTGASTSMAPSAHGIASLQVDIAAGNYSKNGADTSTAYAGGNITLTAADGTNPRVDIVYMSSAGTLSKSDGTAAAIVVGVSGPVPVAWPAGCCPLAICFVPSGATDFTTGGYVLDVRPFSAVPSASPLTTKGDVFTWDTANQRLAVGANGTFFTADSTAATGNKWGEGPLTTIGDLMIGATAPGPATRLAVGTSGKVLTSDGTTASWAEGPLTTAGDLLVGAMAGSAPTRLAIGLQNQFVGVPSAAVAWAYPEAQDPNIYEIQISTEAVDANKYTTVGTGAVIVHVAGIQCNTGANANSSARKWLPSGGGFTPEDMSKFRRFSTRCVLQVQVTNETAYVGCFENTIAPTATSKHYAWRYSSGTANWILTVANGTTETTVDSGVAVAANTDVTLALTFDGTTVTGWINGLSKGTITTNLPSGLPTVQVLGMWYVDNKAVAQTNYLTIHTGLLRVAS